MIVGTTALRDDTKLCFGLSPTRLLQIYKVIDPIGTLIGVIIKNLEVVVRMMRTTNIILGIITKELIRVTETFQTVTPRLLNLSGDIQNGVEELLPRLRVVRRA